MVTIIRGTNRDNGVLKIAAALASMSALDLHRKTLILQVANNLGDISYELAGLVSGDEDSVIRYEETADEVGIDALLARSASGPVTEVQFSALVDAISKDKHELDVAARSNTDNNIEYVVSENIESFKQIIDSAAGNIETDAPYSNVIIIANGRNEDLLSLIRPMADNEVICVGQNKSEFGKMKDVDDGETQKVIVVNDFSEESVYNLRYLKKEYGTQNLFPMPHNILLSDATNSGRIFAYIADNLQVDASNVNFAVIDSLKKINDFLFMEKQQNNKDKTKGLKTLARDKKDNGKVKLYALPDGSLTVQETEVKKFLRKPYVDRNIEIDTANLDDVDSDIEIEEFGVDEQYLEDLEMDTKRREKLEKKAMKKASKNLSKEEKQPGMNKDQKKRLKEAQEDMKKEKAKKKGGFSLFGRKKETVEDYIPEEFEDSIDEEINEEDEEFDERVLSDAYERDIDLEQEDMSIEDLDEEENNDIPLEESGEESEDVINVMESSSEEEPVMEEVLPNTVDEEENSIERDDAENLNIDDIDLSEFVLPSEIKELQKEPVEESVKATVTNFDQVVTQYKSRDGELRADDLVNQMLARKSV